MRSLAVAVVALALSAGTTAAAPPDWGSLGLAAYEAPRPAPELALPDLEGRTRTLEELRGKVVLLFFWTTW